MGKVDDLRKMREAKYLMRQKSTTVEAQQEYDTSPELQDVLTKAAQSPTVRRSRGPSCGHKGIGGKTCTRPKDHPEKNHRYKN